MLWSSCSSPNSCRSSNRSSSVWAAAFVNQPREFGLEGLGHRLPVAGEPQDPLLDAALLERRHAARTAGGGGSDQALDDLLDQVVGLLQHGLEAIVQGRLQRGGVVGDADSELQQFGHGKSQQLWDRLSRGAKLFAAYAGAAAPGGCVSRNAPSGPTVSRGNHVGTAAGASLSRAARTNHETMRFPEDPSCPQAQRFRWGRSGLPPAGSRSLDLICLDWTRRFPPDSADARRLEWRAIAFHDF
jgi:hypothetical protein